MPKAQMLLDPTQRAKLKQGLVTITTYFRVADDQKEAVKETADELAKQFGLDSKTIKKLATTMYKSTYDTLLEENRAFEELYETVVEGKLLESADPVSA